MNASTCLRHGRLIRERRAAALNQRLSELPEKTLLLELTNHAGALATFPSRAYCQVMTEHFGSPLLLPFGGGIGPRISEGIFSFQIKVPERLARRAFLEKIRVDADVISAAWKADL